ncbi:MAG: hypothetical protein M1839_007123 [Geoglossum umbratile]|nr:MAG: hypothetical protein M1839_007123 [Geoglossum umbratile]
MDRTPSFYPTSEVLRMHPDWPLLRPRTPPVHSESEWTEYSRTSSRTSSYYDISSDPSPNRPNWPFPARSSSLGSHLAGNGYAGSLHEVPWRSPPNLISAFDSDSEDEDDKPRRLVRKLKKKSSPTKAAVDRHRIIRPADDETHSLSQGQHGSKDSTIHGSRKWSILLPKMSKSNPKPEKKSKSDKNLDSRKARARFFYNHEDIHFTER